jgi:hypothetical protein
VLALYREEYEGFNVRHFWEEIHEEHGIEVSYSWTKSLLHATGYVRRNCQRGKYRRKRDRKPMVGMLVHFDGSKHRWFRLGQEERAMQDLLVLLDDATGQILAARFVPEESTRTTLALLYELVKNRGTFGALYTDRASQFAWTPKAGQEPDRNHKTQVQNVLDDLGIELILAFSPQARGRSERLWRTLQGRLPLELRKGNVCSYEAANAYLRRFLPKFNRRFAVKPTLDGSAFVPVAGVSLERIFTLRFHRTIRGDHTIVFQNHQYQLPKPQGPQTLAGRQVDLRLTLDDALHVYLGQRLLQSFSIPNDLDETALEAA